ncbi:NAD-dependent deacylase, partial [Vibrio vulnificus]
MNFPYRNIVVLTGAGISAESGIQTFRAQDGLWENHRIEDVATPEGFARDPNLVQDFYNQRRKKLQDPNIEPNAAHLALGRLEAELDGQVTIVTQNIDNLHERGGNKNIIHMHGELLKSRCSVSNQVIEETGDIRAGGVCHCWGMPSQMRPHVVWFGEMRLRMGEIILSVRNRRAVCLGWDDSGGVYPAAGVVHDAKMRGAHT